MKGARRAAILLISLERDVAYDVVAQMNREDIEAVAKEIASLGEVTAEERQEALRLL